MGNVDGLRQRGRERAVQWGGWWGALWPHCRGSGPWLHRDQAQGPSHFPAPGSEAEAQAPGGPVSLSLLASPHASPSPQGPAALVPSECLTVTFAQAGSVISSKNLLLHQSYGDLSEGCVLVYMCVHVCVCVCVYPLKTHRNHDSGKDFGELGLENFLSIGNLF